MLDPDALARTVANGHGSGEVAPAPVPVAPSRAWRRDALRRRMLAGADLVAVALTATAVGAAPGAPAEQTLILAALMPIWLALAKAHGLYDADHRRLLHLTVDELPRLVAWAAAGTALTACLIPVFGAGESQPRDMLSLWVGLVIAAPTARAVARTLWRQAVPPERALLLGSGAPAAATRRKLVLFSEIHVELVAEVDLEAARKSGDVGGAVLRLLARHADAGPIDRILVAAPELDEALMADIVRICRRWEIKLGLVPPSPGMFGTAVLLEHVAELPIVQYHTRHVSRTTLLAKRVLDIVGATAGLVVLAPLFAVLAVCVRLDSPGPVFFRQWRGGMHGRPFRMVKFRTMVADAEHRLTDVVALDRLREPAFKVKGDPRVTRLGAWLRRWSLDELPQLWNVVRGDMSLVGPRPEQIDLVERYRPEHRFRLVVKPGITGPMQVYGRGELSFEERLAVEREYIENISLRRDLRFLLLTIAAVLRGRGAY